MKQIWPNYSYSPTTNVLTLTGLNIDRDQLLLVTAADRGRIMYNFADSSVTASAFTSGANTALTLVATTAGLTTTAALVIYYDDQLAGTTVTVSSLPAISGTVTANLGNVAQSLIFATSSTIPTSAIRLGFADEEQFIGVGTDSYGNPLPIQIHLGSGASDRVTSANPLPISGTVTIGSALPAGTNQIGSVTASLSAGTAQIGSVTASISNFPATQAISIASVTIGNSITISSLPALAAGTAQIGSVTASISGTVPVSISSVTVGNSVTIGSLPAISGTVTANSSNGSLTTRFGSVTTANTAFSTSAVTNANRKYLLIQNVTTASNVITVGIGFTPTTTQGIQLSSGAGLTFEGSYIATGAVNLLSSVTASCFTILEA